MKKIILSLLLAVLALPAFSQVGTWKAYMAYQDITDVKRGGNHLYVLASDNLYSYNENDHSIQTYDKINGLNDSKINKIEWNNNVRKLLIVYSDFNIDVLDESGNITNISDYYSKSMTEGKTIYDIYMNGRFAYLGTAFGILKIDMRDCIISDTYNLHFRVNNCYIEGNYIYASSSTNGLYRALQTDNLLDPSVWQHVGEYRAKNYTVDADLLAEAKTLNPGGPKTNDFDCIKFANGKLYSVNGGYTSGNDFNRRGVVQIYDGTSWTFPDNGVAEQINHRYLDLTDIDVDPADGSHFFVGARTGLYEFRGNTFYKEYTPDNSELRGASVVSPQSKDYNLVLGVKFDNSGNLWALNSVSATTSILEYIMNGEWVNHHKSGLMVNNQYSFQFMNKPIFDRDNLLWFINSHWVETSVICYQPSTDGINIYRTFTNEDGTTINIGGVNCIAEDLDGNIWIGTNAGPLYIDYNDKTKSPDDMIFQQYKVPRNDGTNLADYLLSGVAITAIAVDGGNRKWFGTSGAGLYLISADNNTQVQHFTTDNSDILSDNILSLAINPTNGEVFIATDQGLCSYVSDATATVDKMDKDVTYAYPNPVKPGYTGPITITGLTYNADVKIVTTSGTLVAQGRSTGGSFIWDGRDLDGKRVASGVYMVETATQAGDSGTVCKIAIVN